MKQQKKIKQKFKATPVLTMLLQSNKLKIEFEVEYFKDYIFEIQLRLKKFQTDFIKQTKIDFNNDFGKDANYFSIYENESNRVNENFPSLFYNSTFLALFSYFENCLNTQCQLLFKYKNRNVYLENIKEKNYIKKCKKYLVNEFEIDLCLIQKEWNLIMIYQKIRNCIVHNNSNIKVYKNKKIEEQPLFHFMKTSSNLTFDITTGNFKIMEENFLLDFCDLLKIILITIYKQIELKEIS